MSLPLLWAVDLVAVSILAFGLYYPRHRRRDLLVAYLVVNVGVLVVATALASTAVAAGLGLGLFGVLSIIRLRSAELSQHEVAYYFASLALGLLGGLGQSIGWLAVAGSALILLVLAVADHPRLFTSHQSQTVVLDRAFPDHVALVARLEQLLGGRVHAATVQRLDLVNDSTTVTVRFTAPAPRPATPGALAPAQTAGAAASAERKPVVLR